MIYKLPKFNKSLTQFQYHEKNEIMRKEPFTYLYIKHFPKSPLNEKITNSTYFHNLDYTKEKTTKC